MTKKNLKDAMVSTGKDDWETPPEFFAACEKKFGKFHLDACASKNNAKCSYYIDPTRDALTVRWAAEHIWMNPPYSRGNQKNFLYKALKTSLEQGGTVTCLVPVRTGTLLWQDLIFKSAAEIYFLKGRLKFVGAKDSAPFESAIVRFMPLRHSNRPLIGTWDWRKV